MLLLIFLVIVFQNEIKHLTACEVHIMNHKARDVPVGEIFHSPPGVVDEE